MTLNARQAPGEARIEEIPTAAGSVTAPAAPQLTASQLLPKAAALRYEASVNHQTAVGLDHIVSEMTVDERAARYEHLEAASLLEALTRHWGLSWVGIAKLMSVSVPAIRKWRRGEGTAPTNRSKLARLVALLDTLDFQYMIEDPASWLEIPLGPTPITLSDVAGEGRLDLVLDYASRRIDLPEGVLDRFAPDWRERYRSKFDVVQAEDGYRAIQMRSEDH